MMLAETIANNINWSLIANAVMAIGTIGLWLSSRKPSNTEISPQPLIVAMEKEFTTKREFENHVAHVQAEHDKIFSKIGGVERGANSSIENKVEVVRKDLVIVSNQVASLSAETKGQNQQLARMDAKLDRIAERTQS